MNNPSDFAVRPMQRADAAAVAALSAQLGYPATESEIGRRLDAIVRHEDACALVAEADGLVIGWIHAYRVHLIESDDHVEIGGLVVEETSRRRGAGRALLAAAEAWSRLSGCPAIRLRSQLFRADAHAFYERLGYEYVKTQKTFRKIIAT
jgi:predicted N-acetyltransferase YhbS